MKLLSMWDCSVWKIAQYVRLLSMWDFSVWNCLVCQIAQYVRLLSMWDCSVCQIAQYVRLLSMKLLSMWDCSVWSCSVCEIAQYEFAQYDPVFSHHRCNSYYLVIPANIYSLSLKETRERLLWRTILKHAEIFSHPRKHWKTKRKLMGKLAKGVFNKFKS